MPELQAPPREHPLIEVGQRKTVLPGKPTIPWSLWFEQLHNTVATIPDGTPLDPSKDVQTDSSGDLTSISNTGTLLNAMSNTPTFTASIIIDQSASDGIIMSVKSSDVAHGITDKAETDTYGYMQKVSATSGGLEVTGLAEINGVGIKINGYSDVTPS